MEELEGKTVEIAYDLDYKIDQLENKMDMLDDIERQLERLNDRLDILLDNDILK